MANDPETLYRQLGRLIETMPDLNQSPLTAEGHLWVGRAFALVKEVNNLADPALFSVKASALGGTGIISSGYQNRINAAHEITAIVYRAFAVAEARAPAGVSGTFIPVGNSFDVFSALSKVFQTAAREVLIVDPYMDETVLTEFGTAVPEGVVLRLLADQADRKPTLEPAARKWASQYGTSRPLSVRLALPKTLHDRAIFIDQKTAWTVTQSLKDFAKRSPGEIVRADDTAAMKIAAYESIWQTASVIV